MLLAVQANHKGGNIHHLLAHTAKRTNVTQFSENAELLFDWTGVSNFAGFIDEEFLTPQTV